MLKTLVAAAMLLLTTGCATSGPLRISCADFETAHRVKLPATGLEQDVHQGGGALALEAAEANPLIREMRSLFSVKAEAAVDGQPAILLLSGGGQWGAFGTGFLKTLHERGRLPDFQLITGVSTGGLQSIFVALGSDEAYAKLERAYSPARERDVVDRGPQALAAVTGAMAGLKPLRRRIEQELCPDLSKPCAIDQLRRLDKKVLIGFIEARSGDFYYADAVELARIPDKGVARQCLTGVALASAAMPVFFQQVQINGLTYYDGGVRQSVFEGKTGAAAEALLESQRGASGVASLPIFVVRNGPTNVRNDGAADGKADALTAALRAEAIVVNELEVSSIASLRLQHPVGPIWLVTADRWDEFAPDPAVPDRKCVKPDGVMFDPDFMACLRSYGAAQAGRDEPWRPLRELSLRPAAANGGSR